MIYAKSGLMHERLNLHSDVLVLQPNDRRLLGKESRPVEKRCRKRRHWRRQLCRELPLSFGGGESAPLLFFQLSAFSCRRLFALFLLALCLLCQSLSLAALGFSLFLCPPYTFPYPAFDLAADN